MKGSQRVIQNLQSLLESELTAFDQYFIHARMYADWGLTKLDVRISHEHVIFLHPLRAKFVHLI